VRSRVLPPWPYFGEDEAEAAAEVLRTGRVNYWTGTLGREFEIAFAKFVGRKHAIALSNGTAALELALWSVGIGPGDEVIVPARTFIATASSVAMRGGTPVCADIDSASQNVTAATIDAALSPRTKAIIVVHLAGWPCDMQPINELAASHGIPVIEDCAQALGAAYYGRPAGSLGQLAAFSFCQDKIMTTGGEGGMLVTDDSELFELAWSLKDHGKSYAKTHSETQIPGVGFRWMHDRFGTNMRMTEMQSAIGLKALTKVPGWVSRRRAHANALDDAFVGLPGVAITRPPTGFEHAYYKYYLRVRVDELSAGWSRDRILKAVEAEGIPCFSGACPEIYLEQAFDGIRPAERLPVAQEIGETSLMLLVHPTLTEQDIDDTIAAVRKVLGAATS
jgi:hypothetical protein